MQRKGGQYQSNIQHTVSVNLPKVYIRPSSIKRNKEYKMKTEQSMNEDQLIERLQKQLNIQTESDQRSTLQKYQKQYLEQGFTNIMQQKQSRQSQLKHLKYKSFGMTKNLPSGLRKIPLNLKIKQQHSILSSLSGPVQNYENGAKCIKRSHSSLKKLLFNLKQANLYNETFQKGYKSRKPLSQQHKQMTQNQKLVQRLLLLKPSKDISRQSQLASYRQHQKYRNIMSHSYSRLTFSNSKQKLTNRVEFANRSATKNIITSKKENNKNRSTKKTYNIKDIILLPKNHIGITINNYKRPKVQQKINTKNNYLPYHHRQKTII